MAVDWTPHRFSGGVLALDTTNTVVLRNDPARSFDRFDDHSEIARFAEVASVQRAGELGGRRLAVDDAKAISGTVIRLRESTDRLFRKATLAGALDTAELSRFLSACASALDGRGEAVGEVGRPFGDPSTPMAFEAALAVSALSLLSAGVTSRIRICANCCWLFLDASRNGSRIWCDMAVCGNRQKARRHYRRHTNREVREDA